ncbi:MAG: hypothetical protein M1828_001017 [Chrysothrix sp. TS-e1954]|nr:MAG: hypothetical protein M1828_001017 [Chrysothrix sp. TS-e1954]
MDYAQLYSPNTALQCNTVNNRHVRQTYSAASSRPQCAMHTSNLGHPLLLLLLALVSLTHAGRPFIEFDDHILCYSGPPGPVVGWPAGRSPRDYPDNFHLCSLAYAAQYHLGCTCASGSGPLDCSLANGADPTLFAAQFYTPFYGYHSFLEWCQNVCECIPEAEEQEFSGSSSSSQAETLAGVEDPDSETPDATAAELHEALQGDTGLSSSSGNGLGDSISADLIGCANVSCAIGSACEGTNCGCKVQGSRYEPSAGVIEYTGLCSLLISGKKRDVSREVVEERCLCNSTYASEACCQAKDTGLVWDVSEWNTL